MTSNGDKEFAKEQENPAEYAEPVPAQPIEGKAVLVTTEHRGVFFGYLKNDQGKTVTLSKARNCLYWSADLKGFLGLAVSGPTKDCRIGPAVDELKLRDVASVANCTNEAVKGWEAAPWK